MTEPASVEEDNNKDKFGNDLVERIGKAREDNQHFKERERFWQDFAMRQPALVASLIALYETQAKEDTLTGLLNHFGFVREAEDMKSLLRFIPIPSEYQITVIYGDGDQLKKINDTPDLGREKGNELLTTIADAFSSSISVGIVGRVGPDEFALLTIVKDQETVKNIANRIQTKIQDARTNGKIPDWSGVSLGVATLTENESIEKLLLRADAYMKEAKRQTTTIPGERGQHLGGLSNIG